MDADMDEDAQSKERHENHGDDDDDIRPSMTNNQNERDGSSKNGRGGRKKDKLQGPVTHAYVLVLQDGVPLCAKSQQCAVVGMLTTNRDGVYMTARVCM
jgi:hypothetical protein